MAIMEFFFLCSKIKVNFHHFFLPLFNDFELIQLILNLLLGHVALRAGMTEFFNTRNYWKEEMELHVERKDNRAAFSCF